MSHTGMAVYQAVCTVYQAKGLISNQILGGQIFDLPGGQINDSSWGKYLSLPFLPATRSFPSGTLRRLFELTRHPSKALNLPLAMLPELQRQKQLVQTLIVLFVENALFCADP